MSERLLFHYNQQLSYLRNQGKNFAAAYPKIAGNLHIGANEAEDPFVARLLEGFAFLTGRVQYNIEQGHQTITENLLNLLYQNFDRPIPAFAILQLQVEKTLEQAIVLEKNTQIRTVVNSIVCTFRSCYPLYALPMTLKHIEWKEHFYQKISQANTNIQSCLSFRLEAKTSFIDLKTKKIRIHINLEFHLAYKLYEIFNTQLAEISITIPGDTTFKMNFPMNQLQFVGFDDDDFILPSAANGIKHYDRLSEFFSYPKKFLFFDLDEMDMIIIQKNLNCIQFNFFLTTMDFEIEKAINPNSLLLNCVPIVNLFSQSAEPIRFDHSQVEYQLIAENIIPSNQIEVYSVERMTVTTLGSTTKSFLAEEYFGKKYRQQEHQNYLYWYLKRKSAWELGEYHQGGSELFAIFSTFQQEAQNNTLLISPELLCTNREATLMLSIDNLFQCYPNNYEFLSEAKLVSPLTKPRYRDSTRDLKLDLLTFLHTNHLSYTNENTLLQSIKNTLTICNVDTSQENSVINKGIENIQTKLITRRNPQSLQQGFCQGIEYTVLINEEYFPENNAFLFGQVLQKFLTTSCALNSFVILILESKQRGRIKIWDPMSGTKKMV